VLLLGGTAALIVLLGLGILRLTSSELTARHTARSLATQVAAADALLATHEPQAARRLTALGLVLAGEPAPAARRRLLIFGGIEARLREYLPGRELYVNQTPEPMLWVAATPPAAGWIGVPLVPLRASFANAAVVALIAGLAVVLLAAALYARSLSHPLRRLAQAAPEIAAGARPPPLPANAVRELRDLDAALARAAADVRAAARDREMMLAALSHDMRTPLARLRLQLELADALDPAARRGIETDLDELEALTGQFIDYVRDGRDEPSEDVDLVALVRTLASASRVQPAWQVEAPPALHCRGKPLALRRAVANLMTNAERHGAAPRQVVLHREGDRAVLRIIDAGQGVASDLLARLGEPFRRGDAARGGPGSGLGLASVRRVAAQHDGRLAFCNRREGGFEASLILPLAS